MYSNIGGLKLLTYPKILSSLCGTCGTYPKPVSQDNQENTEAITCTHTCFNTVVLSNQLDSKQVVLHNQTLFCIQHLYAWVLMLQALTSSMKEGVVAIY